MKPSDELGAISRKHESNGRPGAVGYDTGGGYSYGLYQVSTKGGKTGSGTMPAFLAELKKAAPDIHQKLIDAGGLQGAKAGTKQFMDAWRDVAKDNPQRFADFQHSFVKNTHYEPVVLKVNAIKGMDLPRRSRAVKEAIWSTAVQHGANATKIFRRALEKQDVAHLTDEAILRAVYKERSRVDVYFPKLSETDREKMRERFERELADALRIVEDRETPPLLMG